MDYINLLIDIGDVSVLQHLSTVCLTYYNYLSRPEIVEKLAKLEVSLKYLSSLMLMR